MRTSPVIFAIAVALLTSGANAQTVNCQQGGTNLTEQTICQSSDLKYAAKEVERLWLLLKPQDQQPFRPSQRDWIVKRNQCGSNIDCISQIYNSRNTNFLETMDDGAGEGETPPPVPNDNQNTTATVPKPYTATYGDWTVECSACSEGFEEVRSMCWMTPKSGELTVFPARDGSSGKGYLQWYPPLPDNARDIKGTLTFATQGASTTTIPANKVFFAELDGSFFVEAPYYDTIQSAFTKGSTTKATFTASNNNGPGGSHTISLKGFAATLRDLNKQAPRYPRKTMCGRQ